MPFWSRLVLAYVVLSIVLALAFGLSLRTGLDLIILLAAFLPAIVRNIPRLYLLYSRLKYYVTNHETVWRLSLEFYGRFNETDVERTVRELVQEGPDRNCMLQTADRRHVFRYDRVATVEISLDEGSTGTPDCLGASGQRLSISVLDQKVSYRSSRRMIEETFIPLFDRIRDELKPDRGKYTLTVAFEGSNPFFGLYIQQMSLDLVREFTFEFTVPTANRGDYVRVAKEEMTVVSETLDGLRRAAMMCLAFRGAGRT